MEQKNKSKRSLKILYTLVLLSFIFPMVYLIIRIVLFNNMPDTGRTKADYLLMIVQCFLGVVVLHLPSFLTKRFRFRIPSFMYIMYIIFLYCAIFLGEVQSFYYSVPHWDDILHCTSSMMTGLFGFMIVSILNSDESAKMKLSPVFVCLFAFCFSVTIGTVWEIYEYAADGLMGFNMQKFMIDGGEVLIGRAALSDTMKDIIVDCIGAFAATLVGFLSIKMQKGFVHEYLTNSPEVSDAENENSN